MELVENKGYGEKSKIIDFLVIAVGYINYNEAFFRKATYITLIEKEPLCTS